MAYSSAEGGRYGVDSSLIHVDSAHDDVVVVPDADLLFRGDYKRSGPDLVVTGSDGRQHIIPGYFSSEQHAVLVAPNGASLSPEVVDLLAGSPTPGQYAQAKQVIPPDAIGKVEKVIGDATVIRNGVAVTLHVGDAVYKSDVIQTAANSALGVGFADGTALNLVANTRMALNDYSFEAGGTSNNAVFTLVEGTFAFVAGNVAHGGNMKVVTPVATMGIRGTIGLAQQFTADLGKVGYSFAIFEGSYTLVELGLPISQTGYMTLLTPQGSGLPPLVSTRLMTDSEAQFAQGVVNGAVHVYEMIGNPNPPSGLGSPTLPQYDSPLVVPQDGGAGGPLIFLAFTPGLTAPTVPTVFLIPESMQPIIPSLPDTTPPPAGSAGPIIWNSAAPGSDWGSGLDWIGGNVPGATDNVEILVPVTVTIDAPETANSLVLGASGVLNIVGSGSLTLANGLDVSGLIEVGGGGAPSLTISGPVTVEIGGELLAFLTGPTINLLNATLVNRGTIDAADGGTIIINLKGASTNDGVMSASGGTLTINEHGATLDNQGSMEVDSGGIITIIGGKVVGTGTFTIGSNGTLEFDCSVGTGITASFAASAGTLKIDHPANFAGEITGTLSSGDIIDLGALKSHVGDAFKTSTSLNGGVTTLTVTDTTQGTSASVNLLGDYTKSVWNVTPDGSGGADVSDPPAARPFVATAAPANGVIGSIAFADNDADAQTVRVTPHGSDYTGTLTLEPLTKGNGTASLGFAFDLGNDQIEVAPGQTVTQSYGVTLADPQHPGTNVNQTISVSIGGPGGDNFVFRPGIGADTIVNFDPHHDTIELDHFANAQTAQQLEALITADAHGDAVIELGHHDSITVAGVTAAQLQQVLQAGHLLVH